MFEDLRGVEGERRGKGSAFGGCIDYARREITGEQQVGQKKNQTEEAQGITTERGNYRGDGGGGHKGARRDRRRRDRRAAQLGDARGQTDGRRLPGEIADGGLPAQVPAESRLLRASHAGRRYLSLAPRNRTVPISRGLYLTSGIIYPIRE